MVSPLSAGQLAQQGAAIELLALQQMLLLLCVCGWACISAERVQLRLHLLLWPVLAAGQWDACCLHTQSRALQEKSKAAVGVQSTQTSMCSAAYTYVSTLAHTES